jgi:solute carrier family 8 (sodium/calcium exchanger)
MLVWNPTLANLTLMALGSSAPEILLSVIETVTNLGQTPRELGASTIVGSAAFNLLVISGVSIAAVGEIPKKIDDLGVFAITTISSLFAYVWLWIVLAVWTPNYITMSEAVLTLIFFVVLLVSAFTADKCNANRKKRALNDD